MPGVNPPKPSLRLVVAVIRSDDLVVREISWQTALSRVIGLFIQKLPKKLFGQDKRDEALMKSLNSAFQDYRVEQLKVGLEPWVWTHKK